MGGSKGSEYKTDTAGQTTPKPTEADLNNPTETTGTKAADPTKARIVPVAVSAAQTTSVSPDRRVQDLFRQVFRGPVPEDPLEVIEKLNQVVRAKQVEGRATLEYQYSSRPLSGTTSSSGGQSVAQTSLSERARAALIDAEKRLEALKPMQAPLDPENLDALRTVTLTTYKRLVNELGLEGGPRDKKADRHFDVLIGKQTPDEAVELKVGSLLKQIEEKFNLAGGGVNTPEDSANVANFRIVKENLFDVFRSWSGFKGEVEKDFSEQSAKFLRKLVMIEGEVTDVETAMDEIGYDATDRESDVIQQPMGSTVAIQELDKITVDGLLSWIREFATEEGPEMVESGGGIGIAAIIPTMEELERLAGNLASVPPVENDNVQASLESLKRHLTEAKALATAITTPAP